MTCGACKWSACRPECIMCVGLDQPAVFETSAVSSLFTNYEWPVSDPRLFRNASIFKLQYNNDGVYQQACLHHSSVMLLIFFLSLQKPTPPVSGNICFCAYQGAYSHDFSKLSGMMMKMSGGFVFCIHLHVCWSVTSRGLQLCVVCGRKLSHVDSD